MEGLHSVFRVRHEGEDASRCIADACDVVCRPVRVVVVAEEDLVVGFQLVEDALRGVVSAFAVRDGNAESFVFGGFVGMLELELLPSADESSRCVPCERSGQEVGFGKNLESVADPYDERSFFCLLFERRDDGLTSGERAGSQVISPSEAPRQQDGFRLKGNGRGGAVDKGWGMGGDCAERGEQVLFAVGAGKTNNRAGDAWKHGGSVARWI